MRGITFAVTLLIAAVTLPARAAEALPQDALAALQRHEIQLNHTTFHWQIVRAEKGPDVPSKDVAAFQKQVRDEFPDWLRHHGLTDQARIDAMVAGRVKALADAAKAYSFSSTTTWTFARDGDKTLVHGVKQGDNFTEKYIQYYEGNVVLLDRSDAVIQGKHVTNEFPRVWESPGEGLRYRPLFTDDLGLLPEHFAALLGLNPLSMYGAHWTVVSSDADYYVLHAQTQQVNYAPDVFNIRLTLDRRHGCLPAEVVTQNGGETCDLRVTHYRQTALGWLADRASFARDLGGGNTITNEWSLLKTDTSAAPLVVELPPAREVLDYRLLGPGLRIAGVEPGLTRLQGDLVVQYPWKGHLPDLEELRHLNSIQRPGEATPDLAGSAANASESRLQFMGGIMALVGAVWMFKRRGGLA